MKYIAVDMGSSFIKCALLNTRTGEVEYKHALPTPPKNPGPAEAFEVDFARLLSTVTMLITQARRRCPDAAGILLSTQMHGYVLSRGGKFITPYISWQDALAARSGSDEALKEKLADHIPHMGTRYKAGLAICALHERLLRSPMDNTGVLLHTLGGAVLYALSGGQAHVCHISQAAATGFARADEGCWSKQAIAAAGCEGIAFPQIIDGFAPVGEYDGIPLYPDIGDHQASVLGAAAGQNSIVITVGTGGIVCAATAQRTPGADMEVRPYFDGRALLTVTRQPGGRALDVLVNLYADTLRLLGHETPVQDIWAALWAQADETGGLRVAPGFHLGRGEGVVSAISAGNLTPGNLFYAALDALAEAYGTCCRKLRGIDGALDSVVLCGGRLARVEALRKRIEQAAGLPVRVSACEDEALYGLLMLAKQAQK